MTARKKRANKKEGGVKGMADIANTLAETMNTTVKIKDDTEVTIYKCKAKNLGIILEALGFILDELGIKDLGETPKLNLTAPGTLMPLIAKSSGRLLFIASELCSLEHDEMLELELDDAITIMTKVFEVNKGFFSQSVLPQVQFLFQAPEQKQKAPEQTSTL